MERLCKLIEDELHKIAEKGLTQNNLETAYKLIDMYKDLKNTEYWEQKGEYYMSMLDDIQGGYSQADYSIRREGQRYSRDNDRMPDYDRESSYRGRRRGEHYVRGHYSRDDGYNRGVDGGYSAAHYDRYMDSKQSYRSSKSPECKQRLMDTLEDYMDDFSRQMEEMLRDSDCQEERTTIKRYLDKIKSIA